MRSISVFGLLSLLSCDALVRGNPAYCDADTPCLTGETCDVAHHLCGPIVTGLSQHAGSPEGGITLTLQGLNFVPGMTVLINNMPVATTTFTSATTLQFVLPKGQCGQSIKVTAQTPEGRTLPGAQTLRYKYLNLAFTTRSIQATPGVQAIATGLMDGDANVDLVTVGTNPGVQLLLGAGNMNFPVPNKLSDAGNYSDVVLTNLHGSPALDIVARGLGAIDICKAGSKSPYACTVQPVTKDAHTAFAIADLDKDGGKDVILFRAATLDLIGYLSGSMTSYTMALTLTTFPSETLSGPATSLVSGDFDGDGKLDLASAVGTNRAIFIDPGNGDATFGTRSTVLFVPSATNQEPPVVLAAMKIDQDAKDDLIVVSESGSANGSIFMSLSQGKSFVTSRLGMAPPPPPPPVVSKPHLLLEDLDCDGLQDIIVFSENTSRIDVYSNTGEGGFAPTPQTLTVTGGILSIAVANLNAGDGKPDLAVLSSGSPETVTVYQNTST